MPVNSKEETLNSTTEKFRPSANYHVSIYPFSALTHFSRVNFLTTPKKHILHPFSSIPQNIKNISIPLPNLT